MVWFGNKRVGLSSTKVSSISSIDLLIYSIMIVVICAWHLQVSTLLVRLYTVTFTMLHWYLEKQLGSSGLLLTVHPPIEWALFCNNFILVVGIVWAFLTHNGSLTTSIKYTIAFVWRALWRIGLITGVLFLLLIAALCVYYGYQFFVLSNMQGPKGPLLLRPIKYIFKLFGSYENVKELWANIFRLPKAEQLFAQMNEWSLVIWYGVHIGATASTVWAVAMVKRS